MSLVPRDEALVRAMPVVFVLIWSTGFIIARYAMPHAPPFKFLALRFALSILCFLPWIWLSGARWPVGPMQWLHLAVSGVLMHAAYLGGVWAAVKAGMGSGVSSLIVGLQPVITALWLWYAGSAVSRRQWLGLALGFAGLALVVSRKFSQGIVNDHVDWVNLSMAVTALLAITAGTLYQKRHVRASDVRTANVVQLGAALAVMLPLAAFESEAMQWGTELAGAMAWSVLGLTLGGSSLLYLLIQRGAATVVTSLLYLVPPCAAVMAWALFDEPITTTTIMGTALTAVGVFLVVRVPKLH
ncbi:MAG: DMT family transporter [Burkholderiaceae bacterium]|jgi:drug/metabolite transporter (DMT)-like permease